MAKTYKILGLTSENDSTYLKKITADTIFELVDVFSTSKENLTKIAAVKDTPIVIHSENFGDSIDEFMESFNKIEKTQEVILITGNYSVDTLTKARQFGITKVLSTKVSEEEVYTALKDALGIEDEEENIDSKGKNAKVLSIFGTKGGTGKSTLSVNLAAALQNLHYDVAIIDLDLQFGDVGVFMNVPKTQTIADLAKEGSFSTASVLKAMYKHDTGIKILSAPESPELAEVVKPEHIGMVVHAIRSEFDYIVFDMSPIIDEYVLHALDVSDTIFFVTNPEISTLKNTKVCLNVLNTLGHYDKVKLILNKDGDSYVKKNDMEAALGKKMDLIIPRDSKGAISAINRGIPLVMVNSHSKASKAILNYVKNNEI